MVGTMFDSIRKVYRVNGQCTNCGDFQEISIPKGITVEEYLKSIASKCNNCGCSTLRLHKIEKIVGENISDSEVRPEYINKLKRIEKEGYGKVNSSIHLRKI